MPKGYIIGHVTVKDADAYQDYIRLNSPVIASHGGVPLVRGGSGRTVEGAAFSRHVVFEFPTYEAAQALYDDPEYQEVAGIRRAAADSMIVVVEGVE